MTLSRTARILIAILLLAAAAFFWVNFFYRDSLTPIGVEGEPVNGANGSQAGIPTPNGSVNGANGQTGIENPDASADGSIAQTPFENVSPANGSVPSNTPVQNGNGAPTVAIPTPEVVTRDVEIADLPFLVTEPPADPAEEEAAATAAAAAGRQAAGQRISVNPFSPILIQAQAPAATTPPATQTEPTVTEVPVPGQEPTSATRPVPMPSVTAPAPRPLAPPAPRADGLPRQLPGGTPLASTPDLLREARTVPEFQPGDLGAMASVREPGAGGQGDLAPVGIADDAPIADAPIQPLGPTARVQETPTVPDAPMAAGVDTLSRYLRDNNVVFTGSVLGPVSVGVFRTTEGQTPLVVSLGQTLPETEIVLTDLTGMKAEFTLADSTQVLSLDLRR